MSLLDVTAAKQPGRGVLELAGELDISSAPRLEEELERVETGGPALLVVDLRALEFIDSTGLRTLLGAQRRAQHERRRLVVVRGPETVQRVFDVTGLSERFELVDHPDDART